MNTIFRRLASDSDGQDLIEYGLLAAVLSISAIVVSISQLAVAPDDEPPSGKHPEGRPSQAHCHIFLT